MADFGYLNEIKMELEKEDPPVQPNLCRPRLPSTRLK
jgi:hypothetical protein